MSNDRRRPTRFERDTTGAFEEPVMKEAAPLATVAQPAVSCPGCSAILTSQPCPACGAVAEVNGYRIERIIVQNGHGRMYLARDRDGHAVALKELAFVQPPHPDRVAAFEREARLLRQISHPQIPRFVAAFRHGEGVATRLYLAQEYVEGESLLARLAHHQFSEAEVVEVARQVLDVLVHLQSLAPMVFHRDIKPSNLLRRPDGSIALVDFGAARDLGSTAGATLVGTFGYMPIEQMGGIVDATTDLYALGATLVHLLSRREPWRFLEDDRALGRLNVSPGFRAFLARLLAQRPADRYPSAAAAAASLRAGARDEPKSPSRRLGLFAVVALVAVGLGGLLMLSAPARKPRVTVEKISIKESLVFDLPPGSSPTDPRQRPHRGPGPLLRKLRPGQRVAVTARICADESGAITNVRIEETSGDAAADAAVLAALERLRYDPYLVDGRPTRFCVPLRYSAEATRRP